MGYFFNEIGLHRAEMKYPVYLISSVYVPYDSKQHSCKICFYYIHKVINESSLGGTPHNFLWK